ncbi:MAG: anaerobic ribonucleoside-triphosphate reductase activating protein [Clostridia bacterium]|nr:anaerobic ribonucleoside-triphosphate reductase activating protein [Clostridia bacterium]
MNYATIKYNDISNGPGIRTSLFVSGCTHRCKGCFNSIAWDFNYGEPYDKRVEDEIMASLAQPHIKGLTLLGGEPFEPQNQGALLELTNRVRKELPSKNIWCFSGYTIEQMLTGELSKCETTRPLLENIDVLVDGKFVEELKNLMLKFKGSSNQRTILVKPTLEKNEIVLWDK